MDIATTADSFIASNIVSRRITRDKGDSQPFDNETILFDPSRKLKGWLEKDSFKTLAGVPNLIMIRNQSLRIDSVRLHSKWAAEGIKPPTIECKILSKSIVAYLYENYLIIPERISATVEEGIFIKYINYKNNRELSIEVYNDLDIVALITQNEKTIMCDDITIEALPKIYRTFQET